METQNKIDGKTSKDRYDKYVLEQGQVAHKLIRALEDFERNEDFQGFSYVEEEFNLLKKKLKDIEYHPSDFAREFDAGDWDEEEDEVEFDAEGKWLFNKAGDL